MYNEVTRYKVPRRRIYEMIRYQGLLWYQELVTRQYERQDVKAQMNTGYGYSDLSDRYTQRIAKPYIAELVLECQKQRRESNIDTQTKNWCRVMACVLVLNKHARSHSSGVTSLQTAQRGTKNSMSH